jgi:methylthioribulose-1-phosphate dehydratase
MSEQGSSAVKPSLELALAGREIYRRGWILGTSGHFSTLISRNPLRICVTASDIDKSALDETNFLEIDDDAEILQGFGKPSAELLLHLGIYRHIPRARSILHTHSVWGMIVSDHYYADGAIEVEGYELLKGLSGVTTHEHKERVPVIDNSQDHLALSHVLENVLLDNPGIHGIFLRRHGLYTWGGSVADARRHVEIFEFLFEVLGRGLGNRK